MIPAAAFQHPGQGRRHMGRDHAPGLAGDLFGSDAIAAPALDFAVTPEAAPEENGSGGTTVSVARSFDQRIDGLLGGLKWAGGAVSYSDPDSPGDYQPGYFVDADLDGVSAQFEGFSRLSVNQLRVAHAALNAEILTQPSGHTGFSVEGFTNLGTSYGAPGSGLGTLRLANSSDPGTAYAFLPRNDIYGGDSFYGPSGDAPVAGNYDYHTLFHEIGHALGLKHGHETGVFGALPSQFDSLEFSIMTYRSFVGDNTSSYNFEFWGAPQTFMTFDIAALQHMYGADYTTNSGNTAYTWNPVTGASFVNGALAIAPGGNRIFQTIWDGGGTDTYDLSNYATNLDLDLAPFGNSTFSDAQLAYLGGGPNGGFARANVFNALKFQNDNRSMIENAIGGSGNDAIAGNSIANLLVGNAGSDTLRGLGGIDTLRGGTQVDILIGGTGFDIFDFDFTSHSGSGAANRDIIRAGDGATAFQGAGGASGDRIDLSGIDANATSGGDQAFLFGGVTQGRLSLVTSGSNSLVRCNTDGDAAFEFELVIEDAAVLASRYSLADFIA